MPKLLLLICLYCSQSRRLLNGWDLASWGDLDACQVLMGSFQDFDLRSVDMFCLEPDSRFKTFAYFLIDFDSCCRVLQTV